MKTIVTPAYTFTPGASGVGTLNLNISNFSIKNLYAVLNQTQQVIVYAAGTSGYGYTSKTGSTLTLSQNTTSMLSTDDLMIIYDDQSGTNYSGYSGSLNFQTAPFSPVLTTSAYAAGLCIGGATAAGGSAIIPISIFRNTIQPTATLSQFFFGWVGSPTPETTSVTVYLFSRSPTTSAPMDKATFGLLPSDAKYLCCSPFTLVPSASTGSTLEFATQGLELSVQNLDSTPTLNLYAVIVTNGAVTPTGASDMFISISGVKD